MSPVEIMQEGPAVIVLMAVYNGSRFLNAQLQSIAEQSWPRIDLLVSDDGSDDGSIELLNTWRKQWNRGTFDIIRGPRLGFAANFRHLIANAGDRHDYVAFADQDDLWYPDKIATQVSGLRDADPNIPALSCGRTRTISEEGADIGMSPLFQRPPSFRNAIVQSIAGANTMLLNRAAFRLVAEGSRRSSFVSHDWWSYLLVSGAGGIVLYSPEPTIGYRQHTGNLVGANNSVRARIDRAKAALFSNRFSTWNTQNLKGLNSCHDILTDEARTVVADFKRCRGDRNVFRRVAALMSSGIYRQTVLGQLSLYGACVLKRL